MYPIITKDTPKKVESGILTVIDDNGFPLSCLLLLFHKAEYRLMVLDYMAGFKVLAKGLSPISLSDLSKYPIRQLNKFEGNYYLQEVSSILGVDQSQLLGLWSQIIRKHNHG